MPEVRKMCASSWPSGASLLRGALRAGNDVLLFQRLDPKARREIGKVGDERDERAARIDFAPALAQFAIEMRNDGNQQVGGFFAPERFEQAHERAMEGANGRLQQTQEIHAAEGPAILQQHVVLLLNANAGQLAQDVELIGEFLELDQLDLPGTLLLGSNGL